ncbi:hypothetical protein FRX31_030963, partial [Thalictrum thalictroides]
MDIDMLYTCDHYIATIVKNHPSNNHWLCYFVYGHPDKSQRFKVWDMFSQLATTLSFYPGYLGYLNDFTCKISFFIWKLLHEALPVDSAVSKCHIQMASRCVCCISPKEESYMHLFYHGDLAKKA